MSPEATSRYSAASNAFSESAPAQANPQQAAITMHIDSLVSHHPGFVAKLSEMRNIQASNR